MFLLRCEKIQDGSKIVVQVLESRNGINLFLPFLPAKAWWFFLLFFFFLFLFWNVTVLLAAPNAIGTPLCLYINAMENIHGDYSEKWAVKKLCGACVQSEVGRGRCCENFNQFSHFSTLCDEQKNVDSHKYTRHPHITSRVSSLSSSSSSFSSWQETRSRRLPSNSFSLLHSASSGPRLCCQSSPSRCTDARPAISLAPTTLVEVVCVHSTDKMARNLALWRWKTLARRFFLVQIHRHPLRLLFGETLPLLLLLFFEKHFLIPAVAVISVRLIQRKGKPRLPVPISVNVLALD